MKYVCSICGFIYDEAVGLPAAGIAAGTKWEQLPQNWVCPLCGAPKDAFQPAEDEATLIKKEVAAPGEGEELRELSAGELSALCSNLARGCEKQYRAREAELFAQLAEYYRDKAPQQAEANISALLAAVREDLEGRYPTAESTAKSKEDRGALRILVWSQKVTRMLESILARYEREGAGFLESTNIFVCDICGFIYIGETPPEICPVCKVPRFKILQVQRG